MSMNDWLDNIAGGSDFIKTFWIWVLAFVVILLFALGIYFAYVEAKIYLFPMFKNMSITMGKNCCSCPNITII